MQTYSKLFFLLTPQERKRAALMLLMITIMSFIDVLGVASIVPFVAVLSNPSIIETNIILNTMFKTSNRFGLETNQEFLFLLGTLVFIILVTSNAFKVLTTYAEIKFIRMCEFTMSKRLVEGYLNQPFSWFLSHHSAGLGKTILSEVSLAVAGGLAPLMQLISKVILTIALIALLFAVNPKLTITIALTLGGIYLLIFKLPDRDILSPSHLKLFT